MGATRVSLGIVGLVVLAVVLLVVVDQPALLTGTARAWYANADAVPSETRSCLRKTSELPGEPLTAGPGVAANGRVGVVVGSRTYVAFCSRVPSQSLVSVHDVPAGDPALAPYTWPGDSDGLGSFGYGHVREDVVAVDAQTPAGPVLHALLRGGEFLVDLQGVPDGEVAFVVYRARGADGAVLFEGRAIPLKS
ncbi:MAG: hypothetical protein HOY78_26065 [Saccharothrix sp.]|nr:hypothetical protein [Saccharothrix sp.]